MKYIVIDEHKEGYGDVFTKEFDDKIAAIEEAKNQWHYLTAQEKKIRNIFVLESVNPDPDADDHFDGDPVWTSEQEYEVNITYYSNGATSSIDSVTAPTGYTAEDYISDCEHNADDDWCEMLKTGDVELVEID